MAKGKSQPFFKECALYRAYRLCIEFSDYSTTISYIYPLKVDLKFSVFKRRHCMRPVVMGGHSH